MSDKGKDIGMAVLAVVAAGALQRIYYVGENIISELKNASYDFTGEVLDTMVSFSSPINMGHLLGAGMMFGAYKGYQIMNTGNTKAIRISPSKEHDVKPEQVEKLVKGFYYIRPGWFERILKGRMWFRYLIMKDEKGKISFYLVVPVNAAYSFEKQLKEYYPHALISVDESFQGVPFFERGAGSAGHLTFASKKKGYGLNDKLENNIGSLVHIMPKQSVIDIRFSPTNIKELSEDGRSAINRILSKDKKVQEDNMNVKQLINRFRGHTAFDVSISLWAKKSTITDIARQLRQHTAGVNNSLKLKKYWLFPDLRNALSYDFAAPLPGRTMIWNDVELAQLFFTPPVAHQVMEQIEVIIEKLKPKAHELTKGLKIAVVDHDEMLQRDEKGNIDFQKSRSVCLQWDTLDRHGLVIGRTGAGKGGFIGSAMDAFCLDWVTQGTAGLTNCDPHESSNLLIINRLQALEDEGHKVDWDRVRCYSFDPANEYPTPLNLLYFGDHKGSYSSKAEEVANIILSAYPGDLSKSEVILKSALEALLWANEGYTIADVKRLFRNPDFLESVIDKIENIEIREELEKELEEKKKGGKSTNLDALVTRLFPFIGHQDMQRSYCQSHNVINGKRIIENGEIVLLNFKNAPLASFKLTTGWLCYHYLNTALGRQQYTGKHHYLWIDEAQEFQGIKAIPKIIQQLRKFRVGSIFMTQDYNQMDPNIIEALKTNFGFIAALAQNEVSRDQLELLNYKFKAEDIKSYADNTGALYSIDGTCNIAFPPPAFIWKGERTAKGSYEAKLAYKRAKAKFDELVKRDCRHYTEVDAEIRAKAQEKQRLAVVHGGLASPD